jgi:hypothetical protein
MEKHLRNDFRVFEEVTTLGKTLWRIKIGGKGGETITSCASLESANALAENLNIDPWYLNRGDTRVERNTR